MADLTSTEGDSDPLCSFADLHNEYNGTAGSGLVSDRAPARQFSTLEAIAQVRHSSQLAHDLTMFHGQPTRTCLAIGPDDDETIDVVTGHLQLR